MSANDELKVLLAGPDLVMDRALHERLAGDYSLGHADTLGQAQQLMQCGEFDVVVCEQRFPDGSGVEFLQHMRVSHPNVIRVLALSRLGGEDVAQAVREAAIYQIITPPLAPEQVSLVLKRALESRELARIHRYLSRELKFADEVLRRQSEPMNSLVQETYEFDKLVFCSNAMADLCNLAKRAAATNLPVLIQGETGTGKELMARAIHLYSGRQKQMFAAQNCAALSDSMLQSELFGHKRGAFAGAICDRVGLFTAADHGTVFLDEISDTSAAVQAGLLRILQDGEVKILGSDQPRRVDVRIVAASNRPLENLVAEGSFRRDLYYRLRGFELQIPPLRERPEDIPVLTRHLVKRCANSLKGRRVPGIAADVLQKLQAYAFPGNVRELENEVRRMVAMVENGEFITVRHLSSRIARGLPRPERLALLDVHLRGSTLKQTVERLEAALVWRTLQRHNWNNTRASRELGLSRVGLANKIKRYALSRSRPVAEPTDEPESA